MRKIKTIFTLGLLILIVPFTGFPISWKSSFINLAGILISIISFVMYRVAMRDQKILEIGNNSDMIKN